MMEIIEQKRNDATKQLAELGERHSPIYAEEEVKSELRGTVRVLEELLGISNAVEDSDRKLYRVELVDFIDADSEHEAIDIFVKCIHEIDLHDEAFDVYEIDPSTKKAVKT